MKIFCDKYNSGQDLFLNNILSNQCIDKNLQLHFLKDQIYLLNSKYKDPVKIYIDFNDPKFIKKNNQRLHDKKDVFWKVFSQSNSAILDCTAGFGRDSFLLDSMGHDVTMIENSPIVAMLLKNALRRSNNINIKLFFGNAYDYMKHSNEKYDYIYIDFMFEKLKNKSLSSKNDEALKMISFNDNDKNKIIQLAQSVSNKKVIVKEPRNTVSGILKPNYIIKTRLLKYNIYLRNDG